jgi:hypothetical protein
MSTALPDGVAEAIHEYAVSQRAPSTQPAASSKVILPTAEADHTMQTQKNPKSRKRKLCRLGLLDDVC